MLRYIGLPSHSPALAREHDLTLERKAGDCTACGYCDGRCPFYVAQSQRMQTILEYFGQQPHKKVPCTLARARRWSCLAQTS